MKETLTAAALMVAAFAVALLPSFFLALVGEPQALWLWRDVLGVL
jgi:hypothetical protein